jgi:hypothetical protein
MNTKWMSLTSEHFVMERGCDQIRWAAMHEFELVRVLQEVFDDVWQEIEPKVSRGDADIKRGELARQIILAHRSGLKPEEIRAAVLRGNLVAPER